MDILFSVLFFSVLVVVLIVNAIVFKKQGKTVKNSEAKSFGGSILADNILKGVKQTLVGLFAWFVLLTTPQHENGFLMSLGEKNAVEFLALCIFLINVLTLQGLSFGLARNQEDREGNFSLLVSIGLVSLAVLLVSVLHIIKFYCS